MTGAVMQTLGIARALPPLMQLGLVVPLGILMGIEKVCEVSIEPNGVREGLLYVVAAHKFGAVKFWSFSTEEGAWDFFDNGIMLRRVLVRRTGPVDYEVLGRAGASDWVDGDIFRELNLRIARPRQGAHQVYLIA